jgi:hypothetical protein
MKKQIKKISRVRYILEQNTVTFTCRMKPSVPDFPALPRIALMPGAESSI